MIGIQYLYNGLTLNDDALLYYLTMASGFDSPGLREVREDRSGMNGQIDYTNLLGERLISFMGEMLANNLVEKNILRANLINAFLVDGNYHWLKYQVSGEIPKQIYCKVFSLDILDELWDDPFGKRFTINLLAIDPRIYSQEELTKTVYIPSTEFYVTNLIDNPSIEVDTTGYAAQGSAISRVLTEFYKGVASLKIITDNNGANEGVYNDVTDNTSGGEEYTMSLFVKGTGTVRLSFQDNVSGIQYDGIITLTDTWTRYSLTKTFDAGSTWRRLRLDTNVQQGITFYMDAVMLTEGDILYSYFEGTRSVSGRIFDKVYPKTYGTVQTGGKITCINDGNYPVLPIVKLYGPLSNPKIRNNDDEQKEILINIVVADGDYLELDFEKKTIMLNSASRYHYLDTESKWWKIKPGNNEIEFRDGLGNINGKAEIIYKHSWI